MNHRRQCYSSAELRSLCPDPAGIPPPPGEYLSTAISDGRRPYRRCRGGSRRRIPVLSPARRLAHSENLRKANPKKLIQISTTPTFDAQISCCLINARSVCNKNGIILDYIISNDIDLAVITETWLDEGANFDNVIGSLSPPGYTLIHSPRHGE